DAIQIELTPYLEFNPESARGLESDPRSALPTLRLAGTLTDPLTVAVQITGGTATLGTDYTTPNGTTTFNVIIPPGDYDGTQAIPTGIEILNDQEIEASETILLAIVPNPAAFTIASVASCGAEARSATVYTIDDNDAS